MASASAPASNGKEVTLNAGNAVAGRMNAFENFVRVQSDAALRQVAGQYAYDDNEGEAGELTPCRWCTWRWRSWRKTTW